MTSKSALIKMLQTHKKAEASMVIVCAKLEKEVHTAAAKLLLSEMRLDSQKHENILTEILKVLEGIPTPEKLWDARIDSYVDMQVLKKELERHVKLESDMLNDVEKEIKETDDEALKTLLTHIAEDEKKHHKNMELIIKKSYAFTP
jgi:rubrerythrin